MRRVSLLGGTLLFALWGVEALPWGRRVQSSDSSLRTWKAEQQAFCRQHPSLAASCGTDCPEVLLNSSDHQRLKIFVYADNDIVASHLRKDQLWEQLGISEMKRAMRATPPGWTVLDIGSNLGWYALTAAAQVSQP